MKIPAILFFFFLAAVHCSSQTLEDLHDKKQKTAEDIRYTTDLLKTAVKDEKASLNRLRLLNNRIYQRNQLISAIDSESYIISSFIDENVSVIGMLQKDIEDIKGEYARLIRFAYLNRNINDKLVFILSAEDFNQAYRRYLYLKQYTRYRETQAGVIRSLQNMLAAETVELESRRREKESLGKRIQSENQELKAEKSEQGEELKKLQGQQRDLRRLLAEQQRIEQQLERQIQQIIEEEARRSGKPRGSGFVLTPEQQLTGANFEQNRTRLPWPVEKGIVTDQFGVHPHPVLKNISIRNNGIDISTEPGAYARAVFEGEVSRVFAIAGGNMAVILRHGSFLTVYSNLVNVIVKKGEKIKVKQPLGTIFTDKSDGNKTILKFQVWKESQKQDPEQWIAR